MPHRLCLPAQLVIFLSTFCLMPSAMAQRPSIGNSPQPASLEVQVGQMLFVGFSGTQSGDAGVERARQLAEAGKIGGMIVHAYNVVSPGQLKDLIKTIHSWDTPYPLLVCVDQEGGSVQRLKAEKNFTDYPSALEVGGFATQQADAIYSELAFELADLGFDMNFGPVVDLHNDQSAAIGARGRSFSPLPEQVAKSAAIFIRAHRRAHVLTTIKHFVGHGAAVGDTHQGFADITQQYHPSALTPYAMLIDHELVDAVMTAHLTNRQIEPLNLPMTFSSHAVEDLLRDQFNFDGVIISDDLQMGALTRSYTLEQILAGTILAGHDILLFSQNAAADGRSPSQHREIPQLFEQTLATVQDALAAKRLTPECVHRHFLRILSLKQNRGRL